MMSTQMIDFFFILIDYVYHVVYKLLEASKF